MHKNVKLIPDLELAFHDRAKAMEVANHLIDESYCVMISTEENLTILNIIWTPETADRNYDVFMDREDFDENFCQFIDDEDAEERMTTL